MHFVLTLRGTQGTTEGDHDIMSLNGIPLTIKVTQYDKTGNNVLRTETKPFYVESFRPYHTDRALAFGETFMNPNGVNDIEVLNDRDELVRFRKVVP